MDKIKVHIEVGFILQLILCLLLLPIQITLSWLTASAVHELGHFLCIKILRKQIAKISVDFSGAKIYSQSMEPWQELLTAVSGPIAGLTLILFSQQMPMIALFGFVQTICNIIPIYPMDGGRVLIRLLHWLCNERTANKIYGIVAVLIKCFMLFSAIILSIRYSLGPWFLIGLLFWLLRIKLSCKQEYQEIEYIEEIY